jgi:hypothetical protein
MAGRWQCLNLQLLGEGQVVLDHRLEVFVGDEVDAVGVEREIAGAGLGYGYHPQCRRLFGDDLEQKYHCY